MKLETGDRGQESGGASRGLARRPRGRASNAFTLIEMMVVIGMLGILMSVAFSGIGQAREQARVARAYAEVRQLLSAWLSYEAAYDDWPTDMSGEEIEADAQSLAELREPGPGGIVFLDAQFKGKFLDPWGTPYKFRLIKRQQSSDSDSQAFSAAITFPNRQRPRKWQPQ